MIRGTYLNGFQNDISECLRIRQSVYKSDFNEDVKADAEADRDAVHILLFDEHEKAVGTVRVSFDVSGDFGLDYLAVLPDARNNGMADFMMHMAFDKAAGSGARRLVCTDISHNPEFLKKYDFKETDGRLVLDLAEYFRNHKCSEC